MTKIQAEPHMLKELLDTARNLGHDKKDESPSPLVKSSIIVGDLGGREMWIVRVYIKLEWF